MMPALRWAAVVIFAVATAVCSAVLIQASGAVAGTRVSAEARAAASGGTWRTAREVPGTAALNQTGFARVRSVSCASAGNCSAGGFYWSGNHHPFVVSQVNGTWHTAIEVPGAAALNQGGDAEVNSVSCASAGNCSADGSYTDGSGFLRAFVVSEVNGTWHTATKVPVATALSRADVAEVNSVSCASAGNCSAGGYYWDASGLRQAFVVSEVNGRWRAAIEVPGTAALNRGGDAWLSSVSCASAGNCSAGGYYTRGNGRQAFVVSEVTGRWRAAIEVPGTAALNKAGDEEVNSVSCASAGNCSAAGFYHASSTDFQQAFVVSEVNGRWHTAIKVPGTATLNKTGDAALFSVSCASAGNCSAGGYYRDSFTAFQAFVVSEVNGTWHTAIEVPGTATLNKTGNAAVFSVSCAAAGRCSVGGSYQDGFDHNQAFVASET